MKKLSQKEKEGVVTKGFLEGRLNIFKTELKTELKKELLEELDERFVRHTNSLMEFAHHENQLVIEALISRIERVERHVGLASF
jgi:hypothetical protein